MSDLPDVSMFKLDALPELKQSRLQISFSGGRTSALMTAILLSEYRDKRGIETVVTFANTGQEHPDTLRFVDACDKQWGFNVVWIEAQIDPEKGKGTRVRLVDFESASRNGAPYEAGCAKYGIANATMQWCTRELKATPMYQYFRTIKGWKRGTWATAIGIRADEMDRVSENGLRQGFIYPLINLGIRKDDVIAWFKQQAFDLTIPEHIGNCVWCWKKSDRKLFTVMRDHPQYFDFPRRMEEQYGNNGALAAATGEKQVFFRKKRSTDDMFAAAAAFKKPLFTDPNWAYDREADLGSACGESCEIGADDRDNAYMTMYPSEFRASEGEGDDNE